MWGKDWEEVTSYSAGLSENRATSHLNVCQWRTEKEQSSHRQEQQCFNFFSDFVVSGFWKVDRASRL
jgi:hypothetical protein